MISGIVVLANVILLTPPEPETATQLTLCEAGEQTVFYGQVQDDFGLDLAVCKSGDGVAKTLTIRWQGEGGGSQVSCSYGECDGTIEYSRYTSAHLTSLQLVWRKGDSVQRLYETLERADPDKDATHRITHSWEGSGTANKDEPLYNVISDTEPLQIMQLEAVLALRDRTIPPLTRARQ